MKWGLIPQWAKSEKVGYSMINAVGETIFEKNTYKKPILTSRCLVPASGFYEWLETSDGKQPYYFHLPETDLFSFAGLYDIWYDQDQVPHKSFSILTTAPNDHMSGIHDRMPVILDRDEEAHWLDPEAKPEDLQLLLDPYDGDMLKHEVDRAVGNVKNNAPELVLPLAQQAS